MLPEYFPHCLPENQVGLPEYCMLFWPENGYLKISKGGAAAAPLPPPRTPMPI